MGRGRKGGPGDTFVHLIGESGGVSEDSGNVILLIGSSLDDYLLLTFRTREKPRATKEKTGGAVERLSRCRPA